LTPAEVVGLPEAEFEGKLEVLPAFIMGEVQRGMYPSKETKYQLPHVEHHGLSDTHLFRELIVSSPGS
jgi:hypothetical protein